MEAADTASTEEFASGLEEHPFTLDARCVLRRGLGNAWIAGAPSAPRAAIVAAVWRPEEPTAFGSDPVEIWTLLREIPGWTRVNAPGSVAPRLAALVERDLSTPVALLDEVYYLLERPAVEHRHPAVRRLTEDDLETVDRAPEPLHPHGFSSTRAALLGGISAGGLADGALVSAASMTSSSEEYAALTGHTLEPWRNQGLGSAGGFLVAEELRSRGFTPVWSGREDAVSSRRVAERLGFREVGRTTLVIVSALHAGGGFRPPADRPH
jgi:hypothetical protein